MDISSEELKTIMEQAGAQTQQVIELRTELALQKRENEYKDEEIKRLQSENARLQQQAEQARAQVSMLSAVSVSIVRLLENGEAVVVVLEQLRNEFLQLVRMHQSNVIWPMIQVLRGSIRPSLTEETERHLMATVPDVHEGAIMVNGDYVEHKKVGQQYA